MKERLARCLQLLKINHDDQISKTAFELIEKSNDQVATIRQDSDWINALNAIAGSCILNQRVLSQSEVYDFLTVAVTTSLDSRTKAIDDMIFKVYRDIMINYESSDSKLKVAYPKIIVDVVAILAKGVDTTGKKIPLRNIEDYYLMRKSDVIIGASPSSVVASSNVPVNATTSATAASIKSIERGGKREELILNKDEESELVKVLNN
jgi:hypothetical protein